jgi:hypothetical protein
MVAAVEESEWAGETDQYWDSVEVMLNFQSNLQKQEL